MYSNFFARLPFPDAVRASYLCRSRSSEALASLPSDLDLFAMGRLQTTEEEKLNRPGMCNVL